MPARVSDAGRVPTPSASAIATDPPSPAGHPTTATQRAPTATTVTAEPGDPAARSQARATDVFRPTRVQLPTLRVTAAVTPVRLGADRLLTVPADVRTVGWWSQGAAAGAHRGTVVLVGHVDSAAAGPGAFFNLRRLQPGDRVRLAGDGSHRADYAVVARRQYPKSALPVDLVFGQGNRARLVLITCGGRFDAATRHYTDNIVVYAEPTL